MLGTLFSLIYGLIQKKKKKKRSMQLLLEETNNQYQMLGGVGPVRKMAQTRLYLS